MADRSAIDTVQRSQNGSGTSSHFLNQVDQRTERRNGKDLQQDLEIQLRDRMIPNLGKTGQDPKKQNSKDHISSLQLHLTSMYHHHNKDTSHQQGDQYRSGTDENGHHRQSHQNHVGHDPLTPFMAHQVGKNYYVVHVLHDRTKTLTALIVIQCGSYIRGGSDQGNRSLRRNEIY